MVGGGIREAELGKQIELETKIQRNFLQVFAMTTVSLHLKFKSDSYMYLLL